MFRTHFIALPSVAIVTNDLFPDRDAPITFVADIRILVNAGVHKGLVFEFGSDVNGAAVWIDDDKIGFTIGNGVVDTVAAATGVFDFGSEIPPGLEAIIVLAIRPGDGKARLWFNSRRLIAAEASGGTFTAGLWADTGDGSYASAPNGTTPLNVPAASRVIPDGFELISPLSVYQGQIPRQF